MSEKSKKGQFIFYIIDLKKIISLLVVTSTLLISCEENLTTNTFSKDFSSHKEKIAFLKKYFTSDNKIADAEYHINFHDNSTGMIAGPSDWDMDIAVKINPKNLTKWISKCRKGNESDLSKWNDILPNTNDWKIEGELIFYTCNMIWCKQNEILLITYSAH